MRLLMTGLLSFLFSQIAISHTLSEQIDALTKKELPHATIGILVKDAKTGQIIYKKNADKLLSPASNVKLFTAAAAMYHLKPDFHFLTTLSQKDNNFYITFSGSPSLTVTNLQDLLLCLKKENITTINGNIILDNSRFKSPNYPNGITYDDLGWYYSAPDTAIILNENFENYEITSGETLNSLTTIKAKNAQTQLTVINQIITVSKEQEKEHCNFNIEMKPNNTLRLFGCMAQNKQPKLIQLAIPQPVLMAQQIIKKTLQDNGIVLKGQIITGDTPKDARRIGSAQSADLIKLITHMLQESDNLYANSFTKQLAYSLTQEGTYKQGAFAIKKILAQYTHLNFSQLELTDGMGTRYNLATPEQIVVLLTNIYNDKNRRARFISALPQAGVSGTLKDRMKKTKLNKLVFAKTGTMHDISSLSGYLIDPHGRALIFSIIINGINQPINKAKSLEEHLLAAVLETVSSEPEVENAFG